MRELCDRYRIVFVADEVMCGFGRTGRWLAIDHWAVRPDLITFAKGVNSGYVPLGGVMISDRIAATFAERPYPGGLTYSGHPLACAAAVASMNAMREERVVENAARIGEEVLGPGLRKLAERHPSIGEVRGLGVFWALELVKDQRDERTCGPLRRDVTGDKRARAACLEAGLLPFTNYNRLHVAPPCTVNAAEANEGLAILDEALQTVDAHYEGQ